MNDKQLTPEEIAFQKYPVDMKEVFELGPTYDNNKRDREIYIEGLKDSQQTATLQARVQELEREKETLLGLLEKAVKEGYYLTAGREQRWQSYKQKHGLQSPENTDNG